MNENQNIDGTLEVLTPSALESIERASIDVQVSTAHRFPRSLEQFKKRALGMVQQDVETAESCIYSRPVGKGDDGKQKFAEGASIRMAEIVAACYGNIRIGARIVEQTERYVKAEGVAHDLESNTAAKSEAMESTVKRNGQPYDERMRIVVAKACLSKALRDAIFRVVPRALCKSIYDAAAGVIAGQNKTLDQRRKAAEQWLRSLKVDDARAFAVLDVKGWSEVTSDHLLQLTGLKTAIKDNEITIIEAFPPIENVDLSDLKPKMPVAAEPAAEPKKEAAKAESKPKAAAKSEPKPKEEPEANPPVDSSLPICAYCKEEVSDMAAHNCDGMKAAIAEKTAPKKAKSDDDSDDPAEAIRSIAMLAEEGKVSEEAIMAFCLKNKLAKPPQKELCELSTSKLMMILKTFDSILPEIQKCETELATK